MFISKERTVALKDDTSFVGRKVFDFWGGLFEQKYKVTKESEGFPLGAKIKVNIFFVKYVIINNR